MNASSVRKFLDLFTVRISWEELPAALRRTVKGALPGDTEVRIPGPQDGAPKQSSDWWKKAPYIRILQNGIEHQDGDGILALAMIPLGDSFLALYAKVGGPGIMTLCTSLEPESIRAMQFVEPYDGENPDVFSDLL